MSDNIETYKKSASAVSRLIETMKRLDLVKPEIGYYGRHREDNIIKAWRFGKRYGGY